jgi:hypothetical protein
MTMMAKSDSSGIECLPSKRRMPEIPLKESYNFILKLGHTARHNKKEHQPIFGMRLCRSAALLSTDRGFPIHDFPESSRISQEGPREE